MEIYKNRSKSLETSAAMHFKSRRRTQSKWIREALPLEPVRLRSTFIGSPQRDDQRSADLHSVQSVRRQSAHDGHRATTSMASTGSRASRNFHSLHAEGESVHNGHRSHASPPLVAVRCALSSSSSSSRSRSRSRSV